MTVAADRHPGLSTTAEGAELALGSIVVESQPTVVVELGERTALPVRLAECCTKQPALNALISVLTHAKNASLCGCR